MISSTITPLARSPKPDAELARLAQSDLVHFDYASDEHVTWLEEKSTSMHKWHSVRPVNITASVRGTALLTPEVVQARDEQRAASAPAAEFRPVPGASFEDAVRAASELSLSSFGNGQPVAVVHTSGGNFLAPLGIWMPEQVPQGIDVTPSAGRWNEAAVIKGELAVDRAAPLTDVTRTKVKGEPATGLWQVGQLSGVRAADPAVLAVVDGTGWHDLRLPRA